MSSNSVTVIVFKFSLRPILWIIFASFLTMILFFYLLFVNPAWLWLGLPVVFFIIYIQSGSKTPYRTRVADENRLTFSTDGIDYGDDHYPVSELEAVAVYLYAFENFEYRDGFVAGGAEADVYVKAPGDQNKISFRVSETVYDYDFYLDDFARFSAVRNVLNDWATQGVNVVLKQHFDDEFIIREMDYYNTPSGLSTSESGGNA